MAHFLLQYRRPTGQLELREFDDAHSADAERERSRLEIEHRYDRDLEVVVAVSNSLDSLKRTHARYFKGAIRESIEAYRKTAGSSPHAPEPASADSSGAAK